MFTKSLVTVGNNKTNLYFHNRHKLCLNVLAIIPSFVLLIVLGQPDHLFAQDTIIQKKLELTGDVRIRIEQDWDSQKADGTFRTNRSRLRFRTRFGATYQYNDWASFGLRVRTGNLNDQQGPHLTLGGNGGEFSTLQIGLEKLYFKTERQWFDIWVGKNKFPFSKQNELFWNDNVYPEGAFINLKFPTTSKFINSIDVKVAHFIIQTNNQSFNKDNYFQGLQLLTKHWNNRIKFFPTFYYFNHLPDIPDGQGTHLIPYSIIHLGLSLDILKQKRLMLGLDYYHNLEEQVLIDAGLDNWMNQNEGLVLSLKWGEVKKQGDWLVHLYYAYIEKYAVVDYFAQNDWARWDYSGQGARGSRLSNFEGFELRVAYAFGENFNVVLRGYDVQQLVAERNFRETGSRLRLDLNIGF